MEPRFEFTAAQVLSAEADGCLVVAFSRHESGEAPFLTFRRPQAGSIGGGSTAQGPCVVECNGRTWPFAGGVEKVVIHRGRVALTLSEAASRSLEVPRWLTVRFSRTEQTSVRHEIERVRLWWLRSAMRALFASTSTAVIDALPKPQSGSPTCRLNGRERRRLGWDTVSHCSKCDHLVFLAENDADADALGRLEQCVKMTDGCQGQALFIGLKLGPDPDERFVVPTVALPPDTELRRKALDGVFLYLNRHPRFDEAVERLTEGRELQLPSMSREEARELRRRLEEWGLVVRCVDQATDGVDASPI